MAQPEPVPVQVRSPVRAGQVVDGKYRVDGVLGAGGMGIVVSATHLALEEPVALKFMTLDEGRGDSVSRARFLREAKAARKLTSAHVARVFDVGQLATGEPYIVMELLAGDDLARHLRLHGRLSAAETVRYMLQVCDAIREAHALGIVHRDLKPQNLFLASRPGGAAMIKVLDFGIAKSIEPEPGDPSLTTSQNVVGSPVYMSPEQLRASKHVDERTDIWSLGVIMFELLIGKVPFVGDSVLELGMRIMTVPAPSLVDLRSEVPAGLADVVQRCLEKDPDARFSSVSALASALRPFSDVSHRSLPFADTTSEVGPPSAMEGRNTGGEFARTRSVTPPSGARARTWALVGAGSVALALVVAALARHSGAAAPAAVVAPATPARAPAPEPTFHIEFRVSPPAATVRLDDEPASPSPFVRDLPRDGRAHRIAVEADGFAPTTLSFRDVAPGPSVTLMPLATPVVQVASATAPVRVDLRQKPQPVVPIAPPLASVPHTTNEAPIIR